MTFDQLKQFKNLHTYDQSKVGFVGVEREGIMYHESLFGRPVPVADKVLALLESKGVPLQVAGESCFGPGGFEWSPAIPGEIGYELSNCQLESRTKPVKLERLRFALHKTGRRVDDLLQWSQHRILYEEVGPESMPLDIYPDPTGRYQKITKNMPRKILLAACRVIGTHVHIGMRDHDMALRVYNHVIRHLAELCEIGNGSFGERLAIYKKMAPDYEPRPYASWEEYHQIALVKGFAKDPRKGWTLIRISVHGTIEFRMFGATDSINRIVGWTTRCHALCQEAMGHS